jgi:sRNA-binding protein
MHYHANERDEFIAYLAEKFPKCFFVSPPSRLPLKANIIDDLEKAKVLNNAKLAQALDWYQSHFSYQYCLKAGAVRVDLNGSRAGTVTPSEQQQALKQIRERKAELREEHKALAVIREPDAALPGQDVVVTSAGHARVKANSDKPITKANGITNVAKTLHPALADMQSAIGIIDNILSEKSYEPLRPVLVTAALQTIIGRATALIESLNDQPS